MKKFTAFILIFCAVSLGYSQNYERIINYNSEIHINEDGDLDITEKIKVYAEGNRINHGIYRGLPLKRELNGKTQIVKFKINSVKKDGKKEKYTTKKEKGFLLIYIGDGDKSLLPGEYEYEINYSAPKQVGFFKNYDELYWNVNGNQWDFDIDNISATVILPDGGKIVQNACFTGRYGSSDQNCEVREISENSLGWSASNLSSREGMTIAVGFEKDLVTPPPPPGFVEKSGVLMLLITSLLFLFGYFYTTWKKYGVDPPKPTVYPQFSPPNNLSPASIGYIQNEYFGNEMLTSALVNLAVKNYLKITQKEDKGIFGFAKSKTFILKALKESDESLPPEEKILLNAIQESSNQEMWISGAYNSDVEYMTKQFKFALGGQHDKLLNEGNNRKKLINPILIIILIYGIGLLISYKYYPDFNYVMVGGFILIAAAIISTIVVSVFGKFKITFKNALFFVIFIVMGMTFFSGILTMVKTEISRNFLYCYVFILIGALSMIIYQYLIKRPSEEKLELKSLIEGLKMYMGAAENRQLQYFNPPDMTPEVFEELLPFAMVLGVDKIWGSKFEHYLKNAMVEYENEWYSGGTGTMAMSTMGTSLASGLTSSLKSASTQPSSSSSGSGGGGFSGGGGGGGGGGGW